MAAAPGTSDYGRLTVMLAPWVEVEQLFDVGPGAFQPPPRVWSAVARLTMRAQPLFAVAPHFAQVVTAAFFAAAQDAAQRAERVCLSREDIERLRRRPRARGRDARARRCSTAWRRRPSPARAP